MTENNRRILLRRGSQWTFLESHSGWELKLWETCRQEPPRAKDSKPSGLFPRCFFSPPTCPLWPLELETVLPGIPLFPIGCSLVTGLIFCLRLRSCVLPLGAACISNSLLKPAPAEQGWPLPLSVRSSMPINILKGGRAEWAFNSPQRQGGFPYRASRWCAPSSILVVNSTNYLMVYSTIFFQLETQPDTGMSCRIKKWKVVCHSGDHMDIGLGDAWAGAINP